MSLRHTDITAGDVIRSPANTRWRVTAVTDELVELACLDREREHTCTTSAFNRGGWRAAKGGER